MQLDIRTLIFNLLLFALVFAIGIFLLQRSQPRLRALRWWSAAIIAAGAGFLLLSLRDSIPDLLSVVVANDLMLLALCLFLEGVVVFRRLPRGYVWRISAPLIAILTLLLLYFTYAEASVAARIVAVSLINAIPVTLAAWLLIRDIPRDLRPSHYFTAAGFIQFAIVSVGRIAHTLISPPADLMAPGPVQAAIFLSIFFLLVVSSFGCVWMVSAYLAEELEQQARTDPLTGAMNRLALDEILARELSRARRGKHALSLLMFDLDHFKALNDRLGHQAGDMALRSVAAATQQQLRATDLLARYGGEEFVVVLPDADKAHAIETAQRLRKRVGALAHRSRRRRQPDGQLWRVYLSGGRRRPGQPGRPCRRHDVCRQAGRAQLRLRRHDVLSQANGARPCRRRALLQALRKFSALMPPAPRRALPRAPVRAHGDTGLPPQCSSAAADSAIV